MTDDTWMEQAKCKEMPSEWFFPIKPQPGQRVLSKDTVFSPWKAKRVCHGRDGEPSCPVRLSCLSYALARNLRHGVWGGTTDGERRAMKKHRKTS